MYAYAVWHGMCVFVSVMRHEWECEGREGDLRRDFREVRLRDVSSRHPGRESVHGKGSVRFAPIRIHPGRESVPVRDAPSLPPFKKHEKTEAVNIGSDLV